MKEVGKLNGICADVFLSREKSFHLPFLWLAICLSFGRSNAFIESTLLETDSVCPSCRPAQYELPG